jgi:hypothetical protein
VLAPAQVGVHHAALDRAGPHDGDLHHQVVVAARLQARQHGHLRPALDLKHADCVGLADHVVGLHIARFDLVHLQLAAAHLVHQRQAAANRRQHAQRQHIDL